MFSFFWKEFIFSLSEREVRKSKGHVCIGFVCVTWLVAPAGVNGFACLIIKILC